MLKKEFKNRVIPGQPTRGQGKPYKEIFYNSAFVEVDHMDNMKTVQTMIRDLGYQADSNSEWIIMNPFLFLHFQLLHKICF